MKYVLELFDVGQERFQPDEDYEYKGNQKYNLDQRFLAALVGSIALGLPFIMMFGAMVGGCFYNSLSHFYYARLFGDILVLALAVIGTFLIAYRGANRSESRLATLAGCCAFGVAMFPTTGRGCNVEAFSHRILVKPDLLSSNALPTDPRDLFIPKENFEQLFMLFKNVDILHYGSAALVFSFLAFYSFFVFTRTIKSKHLTNNGRLNPVKKHRNIIYICSGTVIVICMIMMAVNSFFSPWTWWDDIKATFWFESIALWAFGVSWMVKGRFWGYFLLDPDHE